MEEGGFSQDPADRLIREIIRTRREATPEEVERIVRRMATVPFDRRYVRVPPKHRGMTYRSRTLGSREDALLLHLTQRVVAEEQWVHGTDGPEYLDDLRNAVRDPSARLAVYKRRGGNIAAAFSRNTIPKERRGSRAQPYVLVVYSADRGKIISGYQVSSLETVDIPEDVVWLNR